jgi:hypothetical protein
VSGTDRLHIHFGSPARMRPDELPGPWSGTSPAADRAAFAPAFASPSTMQDEKNTRRKLGLN